MEKINGLINNAIQIKGAKGLARDFMKSRQGCPEKIYFCQFFAIFYVWNKCLIRV